MRPNRQSSPQEPFVMTLLIQCPVCSQSLVFRGHSHVTRARCPACEAPLRVRNPQLSEHEILSIIGRPGTGA